MWESLTPRPAAQQVARGLDFTLRFSDLETSMWSDDDAGKDVLGRMRGVRSASP